MYFRQFALGAVMVFAVISSAHAEDAVVPDEFDQQQAVGACDAYGTGFVKLPGTNTCARVSGQVRYEKHFSGSDSSGGRTTLNFETRSD
jgi:opacity protein-like surface antigen